MSWEIPGLIPADFPEDFDLNFLTLGGRRIITARRRGVTLHLVRSTEGKWRVTKFHGGKVIRELETAQLPSDLINELERRRRRERSAA